MITPHGGHLVNRLLSEQGKQAILSRVNEYKTFVLSREQIADVRNIASGAFSPLTGFLKKEDFLSVVEKMRLANGILWPIPIILDVQEQDFQNLKDEQSILLVNSQSKPIALLENPEFFDYDKASLAKNVFGTMENNHPGVENVFQMAKYLLGGDIKLIDTEKDIFPEYNLTPTDTRKIFEDRGWQTITAFQTRNVPHRGHEFLQKYALQQTDGLFVQPVIGEKKIADFKDEFILGAYQLLIDNFFPENKVVLGVLPLKMRYAGPREALFHSLIRKNFGCTHFIVGRDHAGVGDYYKPFDAQKIFDNFAPEELGINILKLGKIVWCPNCCEFVFEGQCPHPEATQITFSGSQIREKIEKRQDIPPYFLRPEVYHLLGQSLNPLVDDTYNHQRQNNTGQKGFVLWFTGLPCSGKSTIATAIFEKLQKRNLNVERLDGDIVRQSLTRDLGFTKKDRDENIRRVGFVAKSLSKNGVGVVASFISPYKAQRENLRKEIDNFIEVFVSCPLKVCEQRDTKGMYAKARIGQIKNFTGISDPYEEPENPKILLQTDKDPLETSINKVLSYLQQKDFI